MKNPVLRISLMIATVVLVAYVSFQFGKSSSTVEWEAPLALPEIVEGESSAASEALGAYFREVVVLESTSEKWTRSIGRLDEASAPRMFEQLQALPNGPEKSAKLRSFFKRWGELDGPGAMEAIQSMRGRERLSLLSEAVAGWGRVDPAAAWEELMQASNDGRLFRPEMEGAMRGGIKEPMGLSPIPFLKDLAGRDLEQAMALMDSYDARGFGVRENFRAVLETVAKNGDYNHLLDQVLSSGNAQNSRLSDLFNVWGRYDLDAPLSALSSLEDSNLANRAMAGLMNGWASVDGREAFAYALDNSDDPMMARNLGNIARILAQSSTAAEIVSLFDDIEDPEQRAQIASSVVGDIAKADPESALEWANSLGQDRTRDRSVSRVLQTWAGSDFDAAKQVFLSSAVSDQVREQSLLMLVEQGKKQPNSIENALELISAVDNEKVRKNAISFLAGGINQGQFKSGGSMTRKDYISLVEGSGVLSDKEKEVFLRTTRKTKKKG